MTLISFSTIAAHVADVTPEMIGKCHAVFVGSKKFYKVASSDGTKEYTVYRSKTHGFQCNCPSGQHGFWNVKHASGVCWHVRAAVACSIEEKRAMREQEQMNTLKQAAGVSYTDCDIETLKRIAERNKHPRAAAVLPPTRRGGFSLLK